MIDISIFRCVIHNCRFEQLESIAIRCVCVQFEIRKISQVSQNLLFLKISDIQYNIDFQIQGKLNRSEMDPISWRLEPFQQPSVAERFFNEIFNKFNDTFTFSLFILYIYTLIPRL